MTKAAKTLLRIVGAVVALWAIDTAFAVWAWRSRSPWALRVLKRFNKRVRNPVVLRGAGRSGSTAIVHHLGRRSGTPYATPVIAHQTHDEVIVPLPYGADVDWLRNVTAGGHAVVELKGRRVDVDDPEVVEINDVIGLLPSPMVRTVRLNGARDAVRLRVSEFEERATAEGYL